MLFVRLREGISARTRARRRESGKHIRANSSPRHVPARIVQVTDIPRTRSGKLVELAVRDVVHGRDVRNREALANPEALEQFRNRPELALSDADDRAQGSGLRSSSRTSNKWSKSITLSLELSEIVVCDLCVLSGERLLALR